MKRRTWSWNAFSIRGGLVLAQRFPWCVLRSSAAANDARWGA